MKDIEKLSFQSEMAKQWLKKGGSYDIVDVAEYNRTEGKISFHPNGPCGCLLLDDNDAFGIRCDHLMWAEGCCEGIESFWSDKECSDFQETEHVSWNDAFQAIFVYGNHKGWFESKLIVYHE